MGACVSCDRPLPESRPGSAVPEAERTPSCNLDGSFSSSSSSSSEDGAPPCASVSLPTAAKGLPILAADNVLPLASRPDLARVRLDPKISTNSRLNAPLTNPPAGAATAIRRTATLDMTHLPGTVLLNQYAMVRFLGRGVSGRVFLVMDVLTQRLLALKAVRRPPPGGGLSRSGRRRDPAADLAREIEVMARLHHPNLPRLYEVIDDPGHTKILLVMTLAEGGPVLTRASLEAGRRLPEAEARAAFHGMAKGLAELHRLGIVHGDLKPENVLLGSRVMLTDFGCSGWEGGGVGIHRPRGTPAFLAPELACAEAGPCTPASDVYSLGASLFTLLFGTIPFPATSIAELYEALHTQDLVIPSEPALGEGVRQLLRGCMERDPARRWTLDSVLQHPWARGGGPGPAERDGAHPFSPLQALLTPDALVHRLQPGAGVDPVSHAAVGEGSQPGLVLVLRGSLMVVWQPNESHDGACTPPHGSNAGACTPPLGSNAGACNTPDAEGRSLGLTTPGPSPRPCGLAATPGPVSALLDPLTSTTLLTQSSCASFSPSPVPGLRALGVSAATDRAAAVEGKPMGSPEKLPIPRPQAGIPATSPLNGCLESPDKPGQQEAGPCDPRHGSLFQSGFARAWETLASLRDPGGGWRLAEHRGGGVVGAWRILQGSEGLPPGQETPAQAGLKGARLVVGPDGAEVVFVSRAQAEAAWAADPLIKLALLEVVWSEEIEATALHTLLLLAHSIPQRSPSRESLHISGQP
uniref:Protein kinase domain-containing protein n=1 Tax=Auxenochlorella protothecoides TaxID=3075 RepID=A0A1D1ZZS1_AUXPR